MLLEFGAGAVAVMRVIDVGGAVVVGFLVLPVEGVVGVHFADDRVVLGAHVKL